MKKNSFVEGTFIATLSIIIVKLLGMLYVIPFYNIVGSTGGALYSYAYNIYLLFLEMSSAGLPNAMSKIISEYDTLGYDNTKGRAFKLTEKILLFLAIIIFLILFIFADEIGRFIIGDLTGGNTYEDVALVIRCVAPAILVVPFLSVTKGYLQGLKYIKPASISQLLEQIVRIAVILVGSYVVLNVMHGKLSYAVGLAVSGAFFGALFAYLYLRHIYSKNHLNEFPEEKEEEKLISNKDIIKKIIGYAIPFIIISICADIYTFTDQILVLRTIQKLGYSTEDVEFIASAISTWAPKINMVINSIAMGMIVGLIPTIVSSYTAKNMNDVSDKINRSMSIVFFISLPLAIGISTLSTSVWTLFYNTNPYGSMILKLSVFSALFTNIYMVISIVLQSLNSYKYVYSVSIVGFVTNAILDVPLMYLVNYLGFEGFLGSIISSLIGYTLSIILGLVGLHKTYNINYNKAKIWFFKSLLAGICMAIVLFIFNQFINFDLYSYSGAIITVILNVLVGAPIYIFISYKLNLFDDLFGKTYMRKIIKKITFNKIDIGG